MRTLKSTLLIMAGAFSASVIMLFLPQQTENRAQVDSKAIADADVAAERDLLRRRLDEARATIKSLQEALDELTIAARSTGVGENVPGQSARNRRAEQEPESVPDALSNGLERRMASEPVDESWASQMEGALDSVIAELDLRYEEIEVECRTTICRADVVHIDQAIAREMLSDDMQKRLQEVFQPLIMREYPRFQMMEADTLLPTPVTPEVEQPVTRIFVYGLKASEQYLQGVSGR